MEPPGLTAFLDNCLRLKKNEKAAILYDLKRMDVRDLLERGAEDRGNLYKSVPLEHKSGAFTQIAVDLMEDPSYPVVVLTSVKSIWHHPARKRAKYDLGKRMAGVICEAAGFDAPYSCADPDKMDSLGKHIARMMTHGAKVRITAPSGTDVEAVVEIPFLESGMYYMEGTGGNWPSGEIGFGPRELSVKGVIVYDLKFKHLGSMENCKAKVKIERDRCVKFDGEGGHKLERLFNERDPALNWVGEVAMGLNYCFERKPNGAIVVDPDPRTIVEEKALGTAHFGHGGNLSFGKREGDHADGVVDSPTIDIDGKTIMIAGKFSPDAFPDEVCEWLNEIDMLAGAASNKIDR